MIKGTGIWVAFHDAALSTVGGTWTNFADKCVELGFNVVFPRAGQNGSRENDWNPVVASRVIRIFKDRGIDCIPWIYVTPSGWKASVPIVQSLFHDGAPAVMLDAEIEWEQSGEHQDDAFEYGEALKQACGEDAILYHAPFPYINYHLTFPYTQFGSFCQGVMPQFYWTGNSYAQMSKTFPNWQTFNSKNSPIATGLAPIGNTYGKNSSYPQGCTVDFTIDDLAAFDRYWKDTSFKSYYSWEAAHPDFFAYFNPDLSIPRGKQIALWRTGFYNGKLDGAFGPESEAATKAFQTAQGITADGVFGPDTAKAMWIQSELHCR